MPDDSYTFPEDGRIPAGVWTMVALGPREVLVTGDDNVDYRFSETEPVADFGYFRRKGEDFVAVLQADQGLWAYNQLRSFRLCVTEAAL